MSPKLLIGIFAVLALGWVVGAEKKKTAPAATAYLRVWTGYLPDKQAMRVTWRTSGKKASPNELAARAEQYRFGDYLEVPAGLGTAEVGDASSPKNVVVALPLRLVPGSFATLLVNETRGETTAILIDDTPAERDAAELIVRNLVPELSSLQVDAGPDLHARLATSASFLHVRGLARSRLQIETTGVGKSEEKLQWSNDIDFTKLRRATILISPDPYGRLRPRVMVDGQNATLPSDENAGQQ